MNWWQLAASLAAVLALAGIAWALKLGRGRQGGIRFDTPEMAVDEAEAVLPGFRAVAAVVSDDGAAALVTGAGDRVAVLKRHGARFAAREVGWVQVQATAAGVVVATGDKRFGTVALVGVDALDVRRLAPSPTQV